MFPFSVEKKIADFLKFCMFYNKLYYITNFTSFHFTYFWAKKKTIYAPCYDCQIVSLQKELLFAPII